MLNDGTYKEAQLLTTEDCLMSMQEECNRIINKQIVTLDHLIPVYDITVEEYHNFALNSGVFVHNCDADVDGYHISNLILTFIYNYMRPLIENGYIYLTVPPLYKVITKKESLYIRDDIELKEYKKKHPRENLEVQRFKGLTLCPDPYSFY
jgi:DNA gyrase/topoisomerase IV subunit B